MLESVYMCEWSRAKGFKIGKFIDKVQHYFRPFFETNLLFFCMLRMILALRSIANHFLGVF